MKPLATTMICLALLILAAGCVGIDKDAIRAEVKAAVLSPEITTAISSHVQAEYHKAETVSQASGPQTSGERGVNIGTVNVDGFTVIVGLLCLSAVVLAVMYLRLKKTGKALDFVVGEHEATLPENKTERKAAKNDIRLRALSVGVEPVLHKAVVKMQRQKQKTKNRLGGVKPAG